MSVWIPILIFLSWTIIVSNAEEKTFCKENKYTCTTRQFGCQDGFVIQIDVLYYLPYTPCHDRIGPSVNYTAWEHCCCQESFTDEIYIYPAYVDSLRKKCDNMTSCNVYYHILLNIDYDGKITIVYRCVDTSQQVSTSTVTSTRAAPTGKRQAPAHDDNVNVPVIVGCLVSLIVIIAGVVIVICLRCRKPLNTTREARSEQDPRNEAEDHYAEIEPSAAVADGQNQCSEATGNHLLVTGGRCEYSVVSKTKHHKGVEGQRSPGIYDRVSLTQKDNVKGDPTYDHVVHGAANQSDKVYDHVGDLNRQSEDTDIDTIYNTCEALDNYTMNNDRQQQVRDQIAGGENTYDHIGLK